MSDQFKQKEEWEIVSPHAAAAVELIKELRKVSDRDQALLLSKLRKLNPQLCSVVVKMLKIPITPSATEARTIHDLP